MCTVSMIYDYGRMRIPEANWNSTTWPVFKELVKQAEVFDTKLDQPDCEDPEKAAWMKRIEERLEKLEAAAFRGKA